MMQQAPVPEAHGPAGARLVLATRNQGKVREFRALLQAGAASTGAAFDDTAFDAPTFDAPTFDDTAPRGLDLDAAVVDAETAGCSEIPETGVTFEENSLIKAREVVRQTGLPAVADDSGLAVEVLGGAPGIFSARWAGSRAADEANLQLLLEQLADVGPEHRAAAFVCAASLVLPYENGAPGRELTTLGRLEGTLLFAPRGEGGFGYDPILQPAGDSRSVAQLSMEEKNAISHRGKAFAALREHVVGALTGREPSGR